MESVIKCINENSPKFIKNLEKVERIKSLAGSEVKTTPSHEVMFWMSSYLKALGATVESCDVGDLTNESFFSMQFLCFSWRCDKKSTFYNELPPILLAQLGNDPSKNTLLVYGHCVQQPGPALAWLHAIEAFQKSDKTLPVNLKFCFEGLEKTGSEKVESLLHSKQDTDFFKKIDFVCITDQWLAKKNQYSSYGSTGILRFNVEVEGNHVDLNCPAIFGQPIHQPLSDCIFLMNSLVDSKGNILIEGIYDEVKPEELSPGKSLDLTEFRKDTDVSQLLHERILARRRFPYLTLKEISSKNSDEAGIPRKVIGKFSIRIVPPMKLDDVSILTAAHLNKKWSERGSSNKMKAQLVSKEGPWDHPNYEAARAAIKSLYGVEPDFATNGGSFPITRTLQEITRKKVINLPMAVSEDGSSSAKKIDGKSFIWGTAVLCTYMHHLSLTK